MSDRLRIAAATLLCALALVAGRAAFALDGVPPSHRLEFDVVRQGSVIGHHRIGFSEEGERVVVDIDVAVRVTIAFVTVYRFEHRAREVWEGGRLVAMTARTNDDGAPHELAMALRDGEFAVTHNGEDTRVRAGLVPTSLWNPATVTQTTLFDSVDGDAMPATIAPLGKTMIDTGSGPVAADGYLVDGGPDFTRRVWYSETGTLVAVALKGSDGSDVTYRLR